MLEVIPSKTSLSRRAALIKNLKKGLSNVNYLLKNIQSKARVFGIQILEMLRQLIFSLAIMS